MITWIAYSSEQMNVMHATSAKKPPSDCIKPTKKAAAGFEKSNG